MTRYPNRSGFVGENRKKYEQNNKCWDKCTNCAANHFYSPEINGTG